MRHITMGIQKDMQVTAHKLTKGRSIIVPGVFYQATTTLQATIQMVQTHLRFHAAI